MTLPTLIAICSPQMRAGKTEAAKFLTQMHQRPTENGSAKRPTFEIVKDFQLVKFADPLKAMCSALLTLAYDSHTVNEMLEGTLKEVPLSPLCGTSPRRIMQTLGTEWGRGLISQDLWVSMAMAKVEKTLGEKSHRYKTDPARVVMDDLRFANEMDAVLDRGGRVIRIVRPGAKPYADHASEGELDGIEMETIVNDGTLADLHAKLQLAIYGG